MIQSTSSSQDPTMNIRALRSSRSSTSDDSHNTSSSPTGTLSSIATSSSIHYTAEGADSFDHDKQAARTAPLSGLARRASSIKRIFSNKGKKNAALVDEPASYLVPEPEDSLKGWKVAFAGADEEHGLAIANILREANLGLTGIPNSIAGPSSSKSAASSYSSSIQHTWSNSASSSRMGEILQTLDNPNSLFHTSHTPAELEHFAHMMGGLDALVIDLRSQQDPRQKPLNSASSLIDPLVPALSVPHQPSLWSVKGKNSRRGEDACQCGQISPITSHGGSVASAGAAEHGAQLAHRLSRVLSGSSTSNYCPLVHTRKVSPPSTPSPVEPSIPYARIVLIAEAGSQIQPVIGYFGSLQALSSEQITNKLLPRVEPVHPQPRSSSPPHHQSSISSGRSYSQRSQTIPKRSDSLESAKSVEIARVSARRLKPIILEAGIAEEYLKPALLGKFDMLNGVWFGSSRLPEMRIALAQL